MTRRNFFLQKENDCKFQLCFVKCRTLVVMRFRGFRGWSPLRKFLGSKEYLDWFNNTGKTLSYSIQYKNLLKYKLGCS